jgi:uncharacterized cupin superfamily protein
MATSLTQERAFLDTRVAFPVSHADGTDGVSVMTSWAPAGHSPPLHVHRTEDEVFHVLEGRLTVLIGDTTSAAAAGDTLLAPRGVPHTFRVDSQDGARWLVVTTAGDFEGFVCAAADRVLSPEELGALAAEHAIDIVGPPLA